MVALYSILLAGGSGSRLWPMSREMFPKQMFKIDDEYTLFQKTFLNLSNFGNSYVAKLDNQGIIAILTEKIINNIHNIDCFSYKGYENILHELLKQTLENNVKYSAIIAKEDYDKQKLFESFNFKIIKEYEFNFNKIHIPCYNDL